MRRVLLVGLLLLLPVIASAQETNMRSYIDDCYETTPGYLDCWGWGVGNGFVPQSAFLIDDWMLPGWAPTQTYERTDVYEEVERWDWTCNDGATDAGLRSIPMVGIDWLDPGWHYITLWMSDPETFHVQPSNDFWFYVD